MNDENIKILFCGKEGCGKTTLLETLKSHIEEDNRFSKLKSLFLEFGKNIEFKELTIKFNNKNDPLLRESEEELKNIDLLFFLSTAQDFDIYSFNRIKTVFSEVDTSINLIITKCDSVSFSRLQYIKSTFPNAIFSSQKESESKIHIENKIYRLVLEIKEESNLFTDILAPYSNVMFVTSPASSASKENLYHFSLKCVNECLKNQINAFYVSQDNIEYMLRQVKPINLIITEAITLKETISKFGDMAKITTFEKVFAYNSNVLEQFLKGSEKLKNLDYGNKILVFQDSEELVFNIEKINYHLAEAIGEEVTKKLLIDFHIGIDLPENILNYDLVISGNTSKFSKERMNESVDYVTHSGIPITDFETIFSLWNKTLKKELEIYYKEEV